MKTRRIAYELAVGVPRSWGAQKLGRPAVGVPRVGVPRVGVPRIWVPRIWVPRFQGTALVL